MRKLDYRRNQKKITKSNRKRLMYGCDPDSDYGFNSVSNIVAIDNTELTQRKNTLLLALNKSPNEIDKIQHDTISQHLNPL